VVFNQAGKGTKVRHLPLYRAVADDYFTAMAHVEQRVTLGGRSTAQPVPDATAAARKQLLKLASELAASRLGRARRLDLVKALRRVVRRDLIQSATS
jgi:hypothetical protein